MNGTVLKLRNMTSFKLGSHNIDYLLNVLRQLIFGPGNSNLDGNRFTHDTVRLGQIYIFVVRTVWKQLLR